MLYEVITQDYYAENLKFKKQLEEARKENLFLKISIKPPMVAMHFLRRKQTGNI